MLSYSRLWKSLSKLTAGIYGILYALISNTIWKAMGYFPKEWLKTIRESTRSGVFRYAPIWWWGEFIPAPMCTIGRHFLSKCHSRWSREVSGVRPTISPTCPPPLIHKRIASQKNKIIRIWILSRALFKENRPPNAKRESNYSKKPHRIGDQLSYSHSLLLNWGQYFHSHPFITLTLYLRKMKSITVEGAFWLEGTPTQETSFSCRGILITSLPWIAMKTG